jgi:protein-S-isoprenylcysteine O-methyltransferase Ste14
MRTLKHLRAIVLLPGIVTIAVPGAIVYSTSVANAGWSLPLPLSLALLIGGLLFIGLGLVLMVKTIALFATIGQGTLAPWDPTQRLVVRGVYRHVRNPMISGVFCILLGEALLAGSLPLLDWFFFFLLVNLIYIQLLEEPGLARRFGEDYLRYKANVPRWIPRLRPWEASSNDRADS